MKLRQYFPLLIRILLAERYVVARQHFLVAYEKRPRGKHEYEFCICGVIADVRLS